MEKDLAAIFPAPSSTFMHVQQSEYTIPKNNWISQLLKETPVAFLLSVIFILTIIGIFSSKPKILWYWWQTEAEVQSCAFIFIPLSNIKHLYTLYAEMSNNLF